MLKSFAGGLLALLAGTFGIQHASAVNNTTSVEPAAHSQLLAAAIAATASNAAPGIAVPAPPTRAPVSVEPAASSLATRADIDTLTSLVSSLANAIAVLVHRPTTLAPFNEVAIRDQIVALQRQVSQTNSINQLPSTAAATVVSNLSASDIPSLAYLPLTSGANDIDVFLIAGQSNAEGYGNTTSGPTVASGTAYQYYNGAITQANDPVGNASTGSAWPQFAISYYEKTARKVAFVPAAAPGSPLDPSAPSDGGSTYNWSPTGTLFAGSISQVDSALSAFTAAGYAPHFAGVLWDQGEYDGLGNIAQSTYTSDLQTLITNYRAHFGSNMPFYIFRTGTIGSNDAPFAAIRNAQEAVAAADTNTFVVFRNAIDFRSRGLMQDAYHYNQDGYNEMGRIGAEAIVNRTTAPQWFVQSKSLLFDTSAGGQIAIGTTTPWSNALLLVGTSSPLFYIDRNTGSVVVGSTNGSVAPFYVAGKATSTIIAPASLISSYSDRVVVRGGYAYSARASDTSLLITDISNPATPILTSTYTLGGNACNISLEVEGRYAYLMSTCNSSLSIFDIADAKHPELVGQVGGLNFPSGLAVQGKYVYAARDPFSVIDVSNPASPSVVSSMAAASLTGAGTQMSNLTISGRYLYMVMVTAANPNFYILDAGSKTDPSVKGSLFINDTLQGGGGAEIGGGPVIQGRYAYLIGLHGLYIVDVSNATAPTLAGSLTITTGTPAMLKVQGRYAYVAQSNGVAVYDVSNISSPGYIGLLTSTPTTAFDIAGRYAYTSAGEVLDLGGGYIQQLEAGGLLTGTLTVKGQARFVDNVDVFGGLSIGAPGLFSAGPVGIVSKGLGTSTLSVTTQAGLRTSSFDTAIITNKATSTIASIIKTGLNIISNGIWTGTNAKNIGLYVSNVSGGTNNYDAIFNGGGNVGIGTTSPAAKLQVDGDVLPNKDNTYYMGTTTYRWAAVYAANGTIQTSDARLKSNVADLNYGLADLLKLRPVSFSWTAQPEQGTKLGFIAQEVQPIFPETVNVGDDANHTLGLTYTEFIPVMVKSIQSIANLTGLFQSNLISWLASTSNGIGSLFAREGHFSDRLCIGSAPGPNGEGETCINQAQLAALLSAASPSSRTESVISSGGTGTPSGSDTSVQNSSPGSASTSPASDASSSTPATPPVIEIRGENPATVHVGDTYSDLGATITGPAEDLNLGIHPFIGNTPIEWAAINTSAPATYHINYVATDANGLTATSTRTVNVVAANAAANASSTDSGTTTAP